MLVQGNCSTKLEPVWDQLGTLGWFGPDLENTRLMETGPVLPGLVVRGNAVDTLDGSTNCSVVLRLGGPGPGRVEGLGVPI